MTALRWLQESLTRLGSPDRRLLPSGVSLLLREGGVTTNLRALTTLVTGAENEGGTTCSQAARSGM